MSSTTTAATFGFGARLWEDGKREAICAIVRAGRRGDLISYSELSKQILSISIEPHSYAMDHLLDEISKEEDAAGRGILTALVVLKDGKIPADGFWVSAREAGRDVRDRTACWLKEVTRVHEECKKHPLCP